MIGKKANEYSKGEIPEISLRHRRTPKEKPTQQNKCEEMFL